MEGGISWEELQQELLRIGENWPSDIKNNEAAYIAKRNEVWELLLRYYSYAKDGAVKKQENGTYVGQGTNSDAVNNFMINAFGRFDPSEGTLENFCASQMKGYIRSAERAEQKRAGTRTKKNPKTGKREYIQPLSISAAFAGEDEDVRALIEIIPSNVPAEDPAYKIKMQENLRMLQSYFLALPAMVLNYLDLPGIKRRSQARLDYYKMWCAERVTYTLRSNDLNVTVENEQDLFRAMDLDYLDSFMSEKVRTISGLTNTPRKPEKAFKPKA